MTVGGSKTCRSHACQVCQIDFRVLAV